VSRAFVKEETSAPPLVVPRAPLPPGTPNYVTERGLRALKDERVRLEASRPDIEGPDGAAALAAHQARLSALDERIRSAVLVGAGQLPADEVRFSARVTLRAEDGSERRYRIVGVDEADAAAGRIAFTAPLARALMGKHVGDFVPSRQGGEEVELEIAAIDYAQD
jgi:transcription elongation factor GreB